MTVQYIKKCKLCGKEFQTHKKNVRYCSDECREKVATSKHQRNSQERINKRHADKAMSKVETGKLDQKLREAREQGLTYSELQQKNTLEKIRKGEL